MGNRHLGMARRKLGDGDEVTDAAAVRELGPDSDGLFGCARHEPVATTRRWL
jgi:hypothetical protein